MELFAIEQKYSGKEILENIKILFEHNDFNMKKEEKIILVIFWMILEKMVLIKIITLKI